MHVHTYVCMYVCLCISNLHFYATPLKKLYAALNWSIKFNFIEKMLYLNIFVFIVVAKSSLDTEKMHKNNIDKILLIFSFFRIFSLPSCDDVRFDKKKFNMATKILSDCTFSFLKTAAGLRIMNLFSNRLLFFTLT